MQFDELNQETLEWLSLQKASAPEFIHRYSPEDRNSKISIEALDRAWTAFLQINSVDTEEINNAINIVGICLGQHLVDHAEFAWKVVTDEYGTDIAILALPGMGDVTVCPTDFVAKRWERKEAPFLCEAVNQILEDKMRIQKMSHDNNTNSSSNFIKKLMNFFFPSKLS